VSGLLALRQA